MSCIGTAGHVDHGKSTLVQALTGIDPDRLREEKERGMTIDLGFAWLTLPSSREVSIVDVPGHESFIKNMLAGVGGIDAALLVIAADEGIMPQTREHLAILDLLGVKQGVIALTKADLVDAEWLEMVSEEVRDLLASTSLVGSPIQPVSAYTLEGLPELLQQLDQILEAGLERQNIARPRLPIDRVFSMTGFGTVVTGTLLDGSLNIGQEVEILPQKARARVRSLQMHKQQVELARPGTRVAINLTNVSKNDLRRGEVVTLPDTLQSTMMVDARIRLLPDAPRPLAHNTHVDFYSGSQEIPARIALLNVEELQPGESAWAQLRFERPAVVARRDRFILRIPSPGMTIGGGEILDPRPRFHRRFQPAVLEGLARLEQGTPEETVQAILEKRPGLTSGTVKGSSGKASQNRIGFSLEEVARQSNLSINVTQQLLESLQESGRVHCIGSLWLAQSVWEALTTEAVRLVRDQHRNYPLRNGLSKEEWRARLHLSPKLAVELFEELVLEGRLAEAETTMTAGLIRLPGYQPQFTQAQRRETEILLRQFQTQPWTPPVWVEAEQIAGIEVLNALIEQGTLIKLSEGILFLSQTYAEAQTKILEYLREHGHITVAQARDMLGATRKYVLPLLEQMDERRLTRRVGDERVLGTAAGGASRFQK